MGEVDRFSINVSQKKKKEEKSVVQNRNDTEVSKLISVPCK